MLRRIYDHFFQKSIKSNRLLSNKSSRMFTQKTPEIKYPLNIKTKYLDDLVKQKEFSVRGNYYIKRFSPVGEIIYERIYRDNCRRIKPAKLFSE